MEKVRDKTYKFKLALTALTNSIKSSKNIIESVSAFIYATSELPLTNFDHYESLIRDEVFNNASAYTQSKWKFWAKSNEQLIWLDLVSSDGYKRENSLKSLSSAAPNTFFFLLLVRRLNDWVPQVRETARNKISAIAQETKPEYVADALSVALLNWQTWGRIEEADKQVVFDIAGEKDISIFLKSKIMTSISGPMPSLFSQLGRASVLDSYLNEIANNAVQPYVRAKAFRSLFEQRMTWVEGQEWLWIDKAYGEKKLIPIIIERKINVQIPLLELLNRSAVDRSPIIRQISAEFVIRNIENTDIQSQVFAEKFAADQSSTVSERGEFILKKLDENSINKY